MSGAIFGSNLGGLLPASDEQRPGTFLNILQRTAQPPPQRIVWPKIRGVPRMRNSCSLGICQSKTHKYFLLFLSLIQFLLYPKEKKMAHQNLHCSGAFTFKIIYNVLTKPEIGKAVRAGVNGNPLISGMKIRWWFAEFVSGKSALQPAPFTWTDSAPGTRVPLPSPHSAQTILTIAVVFWFKIK